MDTFGRFLRECCQIKSDVNVTYPDLARAFTLFDTEETLPLKGFVLRLRLSGFKKKIIFDKKRNSPVNCFYGLTLKPWVAAPTR
jgi:hypothetical protein